MLVPGFARGQLQLWGAVRRLDLSCPVLDGALQLQLQEGGSTSPRPGRGRGGLTVFGEIGGIRGSRAGPARPAGSSWVCSGRREDCSSAGQRTRRGCLGDATGGTGRAAEGGGELARARIAPALTELPLPGPAGAALLALPFPTLTRSCLFPGDWSLPPLVVFTRL